MSKSKHSFEEDMQRLEQIVRTMEKGDISLEESIKLFKEGTELVSGCEKLLNDAELEVKKIVADFDGLPIEEVFESES